MGTSRKFLGTYGHLAMDNGGYSWSLMATRKSLQILEFQRNSLERATRIELAFSAWEADVLPLNYARVGTIVVGREGGHRGSDGRGGPGPHWDGTSL